MKKLKYWWLVTFRTMEQIYYELRMRQSLKGAINAVFGRDGNRRYRTGDGPWIKGNRYDMIRDSLRKKIWTK